MSYGSLKWNVRCNTIAVFAFQSSMLDPPLTPFSAVRSPILFGAFSSVLQHPHDRRRTDREIESETF